MFLRVNQCFVMGLVLTATYVLCTGLFYPSSALALTPQLPDPVTGEDRKRSETSYLQLPMFLHFRKPRVDKRHFSPMHVKSRRLMPKRVRQVLLPEPRQRTKSRVRASDPTNVSCSATEMRVRVDAANLEPGTQVRLGTCDVSRQTERSVLFQYKLHECGTQRQVLNESLVYSNVLHYSPDPSGFPFEPFSIPVQCRFNRFHYSYKVGYVPSVERIKFLKPIKTRSRVSLAICDDQWNALSPSQAVIIGRPMHLEAAALDVPEGQRLFLSSCHVSTNSSSVSAPQVDLINNYGCMMDSKRSSGSRFINSTTRKAVRFVIDAFRLQGDEQKYLFIHCEMSIRSAVPTETSKMCSYNQQERRWEELNGADAMCLCCNSFCVPEVPTLMEPLNGEWKSSVAQQQPEEQRNPVQNPEELLTQEQTGDRLMTERLLRTDIPEGLFTEHTTPTPEITPTLESKLEKILLKTPPTMESDHGNLLKEHTEPEPLLTLEGESIRTTDTPPTPQSERVMPETPPTPQSVRMTMPETPPTPQSVLMTMPETPPTPQSVRMTMPETPPTPQSERMMPETPPTPQSERMMPETPPTPQSVRMTMPETPILRGEYATPVSDTKREKFTAHTHITVAQSTTVTPLNTHTPPHEPYRIFEEVFGLG